MRQGHDAGEEVVTKPQIIGKTRRRHDICFKLHHEHLDAYMIAVQEEAGDP